MLGYGLFLVTKENYSVSMSTTVLIMVTCDISKNSTREQHLESSRIWQSLQRNQSESVIPSTYPISESTDFQFEPFKS